MAVEVRKQQCPYSALLKQETVLVGVSERPVKGNKMGRQQLSPLGKPEDTTLLVEGSWEDRISLFHLFSMIDQDSCGWSLSNV